MEKFYNRTNWSQDARKAFALFAAITWPFGLWPLIPVNFFLTCRVLLGIGLVARFIFVIRKRVNIKLMIIDKNSFLD